jgi:hypothetical protein
MKCLKAGGLHHNSTIWRPQYRVIQHMNVWSQTRLRTLLALFSVRTDLYSHELPSSERLLRS